MDIITRNFFRLLSAGAFGEMEPLEPMSIFKWNKLAKMVKAQDVVVFAYNGVRRYAEQIPSASDLSTLTVSEEDTRAEITTELSNSIFNKRLKKIREAEHHAIDTSTETLHVLDIIVANQNNILDKGLSLNLVLHLGSFLRKQGDKVDFIKLDKWLANTHLESFAELIGNILIYVFKFSQEELPFVHRLIPNAYVLTMKSVGKTTPFVAATWNFKQNKAGMVSSNSSGVWRSINRNKSFVPYAPVETVSNFFKNITRGLSEIDE